MADESKRNSLNVPSLPSAKPNYLKLCFHHLISKSLYPLLVIPMVYISQTLMSDDLFKLQDKLLGLDSLTLGSCLASLVLASTIYLVSRPKKVYLVDFSCYKPEGQSEMCGPERLIHISRGTGCFTEESLAFMRKILEVAEIGDETYLPQPLLDNLKECKTITNARKETETVMVGAIDGVLAKTGVNPADIGILIVNCCMFCPTPSLSAMVVNHYKLRRDILSYNIGGMGCSSGLGSIDLARRLLQTQRNCYALVVSADNILNNWYAGNDRSMVISNCIFRMGGAAMLLTNRASDRGRSKFELTHTLRTHMGAKDSSYNCIFQVADEFKNVGIKLARDLTPVMGEALRNHIVTLGPLVLPMSEKLLYLATLVARKVLHAKKIKQYTPDFKTAFEHFCIHVGGKPVLDEVERSLQLSERHMEAARMALYRFGNTSSSSVWYVLSYFEAKGRIRKGDRIWQVVFGSGVKCSSVVWRALRTIDPAREKNLWSDEIDGYPVKVDTFKPIPYFQR